MDSNATIPPPEWAVKMARTCTGMSYDYIAGLLVGVRRAAMLQAAGMLRDSKKVIAGSVYQEELIDTLCAMIRTVSPPD